MNSVCNTHLYVLKSVQYTHLYAPSVNNGVDLAVSTLVVTEAKRVV